MSHGRGHITVYKYLFRDFQHTTLVRDQFTLQYSPLCLSHVMDKHVRLKPLETLELNVFLNNNTGKETMRVTFGFRENVTTRATG